MDETSPQQLNQLTDAITALTTEMRVGFARVDEQITEMKQDIAGLKDDVANMKQDIATLKTGQEQIRDDIYNLQVNLEDLDQRMQIGFAKTKSQISATNASINAMKANIITINCSLFLERGILEAEFDSLNETQDATIASTNRRIDDIDAFLRDKFSEYRQRAA